MTHSAQLLSGCGHVQHEPDGGGDGGDGGGGAGGGDGGGDSFMLRSGVAQMHCSDDEHE